VPNVTDEWRISEEFVRVTFRIAMSWMTGAEMVVMRRRIEAAKRRKVPTWWNMPVRAIVLALARKSLVYALCLSRI